MWESSPPKISTACSLRKAQSVVSVLECRQSLYMLKIVSLPYSPVSCIAEISFDPGMLMFFQFFVSRLLLTQITDLTGASSLPRFSGKTGLKLVGVLMALKWLVYGSCISTMSQSLPFMLLMSSRCAVLDLFRLI